MNHEILLFTGNMGVHVNPSGYQKVANAGNMK